MITLNVRHVRSLFLLYKVFLILKFLYHLFGLIIKASLNASLWHRFGVFWAALLYIFCASASGRHLTFVLCVQRSSSNIQLVFYSIYVRIEVEVPFYSSSTPQCSWLDIARFLSSQKGNLKVYLGPCQLRKGFDPSWHYFQGKREAEVGLQL